MRREPPAQTLPRPLWRRLGTPFAPLFR